VVLILNFYLGAHDESLDSVFWEQQINRECEEIGVIIWTRPPGATGVPGSDNDSVEVEILEKYRELWEKNNDFVGFLSISPYIDYPVVQAQGDKPVDYYLNHDFNGRRTENGTIFACKFGEFTPFSRPHNTVIHGHNLITRNNFQPLMNYVQGNEARAFLFLQNNPLIRFDTLYEPGIYKIISVFQTNIYERDGEYYPYYRQRNFENRDHFFEYVTEVLDRSRYHTGVDLRYGDELLTLSTCDFSISGDIRLVIVARRVRWDEVADMNPHTFINLRETTGGSRTAGRNSDGLMRYKMFESWYNSSNGGRGWAGREWDTSRVEGLCDWLQKTGFTGAGR
jgi:sortase B